VLLGKLYSILETRKISRSNLSDSDEEIRAKYLSYYNTPTNSTSHAGGGSDHLDIEWVDDMREHLANK
jgi:hypothetical protein